MTVDQITSKRLCASVRGIPGGWRDRWDDPDDSAELRSRAEALERRLAATAKRLGERWQAEIREERRPLAGQWCRY
jgi:hypothetical protein